MSLLSHSFGIPSPGMFHWDVFLGHFLYITFLLWKGNSLHARMTILIQRGMVKIETRLLSFAPRKIEEMETTQISDGSHYNFGSDYTHYFIRNSRNINADMKITILFLTWSFQEDLRPLELTMQLDCIFEHRTM